MLLKRSQKNELFDLIVESGLNPADFEILEQSIPQESTTLKYNESDYGYHFTVIENSISVCPGPLKMYQYYTARFSSFSMEHKHHFFTWLQQLKDEITTPDKWALMEQQFQQFKFNPELENIPHTHIEYEDIVEKLNIIENRLNDALNLGQDHKGQLHQLIEHQKEMAAKLNKRDWGLLFIGSLVSYFNNLILDSVITPDRISVLFEIVKDVFKGLLLN